jgi:hypothetical protein
MQTNEDVILDLFSAIEERDVERILGIYHPEAEFHWPASLPYGGTSRGLSEPGTPTWQDSWLPVQPTPAERSLDCRIIASRADEQVARDSHDRSATGASLMVGVWAQQPTEWFMAARGWRRSRAGRSWPMAWRAGETKPIVEVLGR